MRKSAILVLHKYRGFLVLACVALLAAGCASQPATDSTGAPGFLLGLVHGFLALFSFIGSWFTDVRVYAFPNSGRWYDLGYLLGVASFFGGSGASSRRAV